MPSRALSCPLVPSRAQEYGYEREVDCVGQSEEFVRRPTLSNNMGPRAADYAAVRSRLGKRTTPLISYNSIGWNRRHYEPVPDASRPQSSLAAPVWSSRPSSRASRTSPRSPVSHRSSSASTLNLSRSADRLVEPRALDAISPAHGPMRLEAYAEGYLQARGTLPPPSVRSGGSHTSEGSYDPPRLCGVDTVSRPPLAVHSPTKVFRPPWIGVRY